MIVCIIQARIGSSRLPGKVLMSFCGKPLLQHIVERVGRSKLVNKIIIATTINQEDDAIEKFGKGAFYVFDCLSELTVDWYSDRMLANFFMLTCPYLYDWDTATYFALLRNHHTMQTVNAIHNTAQVVIDIHKREQDLYIQPLKVDRRFTKTMYLLHQMKDDRFHPEKRSSVTSDILKDVPHSWLSFAVEQLDMWYRILNRATTVQSQFAAGGERGGEYEEYRQRLIRMMVTRDERLLELADRYFDLADLIRIGKHMIGTGLIGGKTVGMLFARAILEKEDSYWQTRLEPHDSFFIGSDVFYTYLIVSKCWWARWKQRRLDNFLEGAQEARHRMLSGEFPEEIRDQFKEILNYFGQSPLIVRSSSLLEDAYGNAFSGKYESVFCANQGTPEERLEDFMNAVRTVYASTMSEEALLYREQRGLLDQDEQMALLVQRVSGSFHDGCFFPQIAGVGYSYNLYVWNKEIDPKAGVLRLVFGLGTRAVDRKDDDYARIVSINTPHRRHEASFDEVKKFAQRKVDVLNLEANRFESSYFTDIIKNTDQLPLELFASRDRELERRARERGDAFVFSWVITFDRLFSNTNFTKDMGEILRILAKAYDYPVDVEFTANFTDGENFRINLLQCRPFQVKRGVGIVKEPGKIDQKNMILQTRGPIIGASVHTALDRIIYVVPAMYAGLSEQDRYQVARLIGRITNLKEATMPKGLLLLGPGRWGTTTPSLGVPVSFSEIRNVSVLCELAEMHEGLVPDVSFGTHFFNDLVEFDILYMAVYPSREHNTINRDFLMTQPNQLQTLLPDARRWSETVRVIDMSRTDEEHSIFLNVNAVEQRGVCYKGKGEIE